jgi:hypothetical protein
MLKFAQSGHPAWVGMDPPQGLTIGILELEWGRYQVTRNKCARKKIANFSMQVNLDRVIYTS